MTPDEQKILALALTATGASIHRVAQKIQFYKSACALGDEGLVEQAEREMWQLAVELARLKEVA